MMLKRNCQEIFSPSKKQATIGSFTLPGQKNEDRLIVDFPIFTKNNVQVKLYACIDGHGGPNTADFLKNSVGTIMKKLCDKNRESLDENIENSKHLWANILKQTCAISNSCWDKKAQNFDEKKSGAVMTLLIVSGTTCFIGHVGDGKIIASSIDGTQVAEITKEHRASDFKEKERIEQSGGFVKNDRVKGCLAPSRCFGDIFIRTDRFGNVNNQLIAPNPDLAFFKVDVAGFLVLGTDGLFDVIESSNISKSISDILSKGSSIENAASMIAKQASENTTDDVSVVILHWK